MSVIFETSVGDFTVDLFIDERPKCCQNFLKLCKLKIFNFCLFHSIQRNLVAQTGDPTGTGRDGESVFTYVYGDQARFFDAETKPKLKHTNRGTFSMVNNGQNMHGSQFFITLADNLDYLDGVHTVFGEIAEGLETISKLNEVFVDNEGRPIQDVRILHTIVLDDPFPELPGLTYPPRSPSPSREILESERIGVLETVDESTIGGTAEMDEIIAEKEAKAQAKILEMVDDIPDAEIAPPENVLFICKLNQVTTDEDLEIIFSRFGEIRSCQIIRDMKTGNSLQYAFVEFARKEDCENAYFKMDNVLIDDRRIHVDFSQSVAKLKSAWDKNRWRKKLSKENSESSGGRFSSQTTERHQFKDIREEQERRPKAHARSRPKSDSSADSASDDESDETDEHSQKKRKKVDTVEFRVKDRSLRGAGYQMVFSDDEADGDGSKRAGASKDHHSANKSKQHELQNRHERQHERDRRRSRSRERHAKSNRQR